MVITTGPSSRKVVALTFDAGSDAGRTAQILDILASDHIQATFGITGVLAQANPALVRRIAAAGHQIVNHSWDHQSFTGVSTNTEPLTTAEISQELGRAENVIRQLSSASTNGWFRPPYGDRDRRVDAAAGGAGYRYELMWSVDTLGWKGVSPNTVLERCLAAAMPGEIILMHVASASTDAAALPAVIAALRARGYGFVLASALV
jgi:peptidoglycan/xylan/chitin deacetylase (PgdA/CDA1 family)